MEEFGKNLSKYRKSKGLTCQKLSILVKDKTGLDISDRTLSHYENNRREPSLGALRGIAKALNISTDELLELKFEEKITVTDKILKIEFELSELRTELGNNLEKNIS